MTAILDLPFNMKNNNIRGLAGIVFPLALVSCHNHSSSGPAVRNGDVEREIRQADSARSAALRNGDVTTLARLYSDDFTMITSTGELRTKQDQLSDIASGRLQHQGPEPKILGLHIYGNVAVVQSESKGELVVNGHSDDVVRRYTRVYVKNGTQWQLAATHISRVAQP